MNLTSPATIKELLKKYEVRLNKLLGQNFLIDKNVLRKIVDTAELKPADIVLEVGPGIGTLTQELAKNANKVIAVEKSEAMVKILKETLKDYKNIKIINADILKLEAKSYKLKAKSYKVVSNIPYYLTSRLIRNLLESQNPPQEIILLVQKEVAQRICALPPNMSLLSVSVQFYVHPVKSVPQGGTVSSEAGQFNRASPKIISYVSKNCFWPSPKVDSAIIKITPHKTDRSRASNELFFKIVKAGFSQPRKQLIGNLSKGLKIDKEKVIDWLKKNNIDPTQRAETLSIDDWKNLANTLPRW